MNLRKVTIWTTGVMLIATFMSVAIEAFFVRRSEIPLTGLELVGFIPFVGSLCGFPMFVSWVFAFFVAQSISLRILLFLAIVYGIALIVTCLNAFWLMLLVAGSFLYWAPALFLVVVLEIYFSVFHPESAATHSSPAPFESLEKNHDE
jgi:hypothetical protein